MTLRTCRARDGGCICEVDWLAPMLLVKGAFRNVRELQTWTSEVQHRRDDDATLCVSLFAETYAADKCKQRTTNWTCLAA